MDKNSHELCDFYFITQILSQALKKAGRKASQADLYDAIFDTWDRENDGLYRNPSTLSRMFGGQRNVPQGIIDFYTSGENRQLLCQDLENNILSKLPNAAETVQAIYDAMNRDPHIKKEKRRKLQQLCSAYFNIAITFPPPQISSSDHLHWEACLLADLLIFAITENFHERTPKTYIPKTDFQEEHTENCYHIPQPYFPFYGRKKTLTELDALLGENRHVWVTGCPGIGKSELAKNYAEEYHCSYGHVLYLFYSGSLESDLIDAAASMMVSLSQAAPAVHIAQLMDLAGEEPAQLLRKSLSALRGLSEDDLLILDNFDALPPGVSADSDTGFPREPLFAELLNLPCRLLVTTRCSYQDLSFSCGKLELNSLDMSSLMELFCYHYPDARNHVRTVKSIIHMACQNTMIVKLTARLLQESFLTPEDVLKEFQSNILLSGISDPVSCEIEETIYSDTIASHIRTLLKLYALTPPQTEILRSMALMPPEGISRDLFAQWTELKGAKDLNALTAMGFLLRSPRNRLSMHPLLREVALEETAPDLENSRTLIKNLNWVLVHQFWERTPECQEAAKAAASLIQRIAWDTDQPNLLNLYFHFIQNAIPFLYDRGKMQSVQDLMHRMDLMLKRPGLGNSEDRLIQDMNRILMDPAHRESPEVVLKRIGNILLSAGRLLYNVPFMQFFSGTILACLRSPKGIRLHRSVIHALATSPRYANSKTVRLFCYPVASFIGQKEVQKALQPLLCAPDATQDLPSRRFRITSSSAEEKSPVHNAP